MSARDTGPRRAPSSVIRDVLDRPADPAYQAAAERRRAAGLNPSTGVRTPLLLVTSVLVGLLLTVAAATLRAPAPEGQDTRAALQERIGEQQSRGDALSLQATTLRADITAADELALGSEDAGTQGGTGDRVAQAQVDGGATAVQGPGVTVTLHDSPPATGETEPRNRVNAGDLQLVVNALWASGAEAVVVNDQRLTSLSSIRGAGDAIVVDFRGLAPPYEVAAIGDPDALADAVARPEVADHLAELEDRFGITTDVDRPERVDAPAAGRVDTRAARVADGGSSDSEREERP